MPSFLTVDELKAYPLPVKESMWDKITDEQVEMVIESASQNIEDYLDRRVASAYYSETILGNDRNFLILENRPILSVQSIATVAFNGVETSYDVDDLRIESEAGLIRWVDSTFYAFWDDYWWTVDYRAGYTTIPGPIKYATALQSVSMLQPLFRGGTNFVEVELIEGVNETIVDVLERYKNKRIG